MLKQNNEAKITKDTKSIEMRTQIDWIVVNSLFYWLNCVYGGAEHLRTKNKETKTT